MLGNLYILKKQFIIFCLKYVDEGLVLICKHLDILVSWIEICKIVCKCQLFKTWTNQFKKVIVYKAKSLLNQVLVFY